MNLLNFLNEELKGFGLTASHGDPYCGGVVILDNDGRFAASIAARLSAGGAVYVISTNYSHIRASLDKAVRNWTRCASGSDE